MLESWGGIEEGREEGGMGGRREGWKEEREAHPRHLTGRGWSGLIESRRYSISSKNCWLSPSSRHSWACFTLRTTVISYSPCMYTCVNCEHVYIVCIQTYLWHVFLTYMYFIKEIGIGVIFPWVLRHKFPAQLPTQLTSCSSLLTFTFPPPPVEGTLGHDEDRDTDGTPSLLLGTSDEDFFSDH